MTEKTDNDKSKVEIDKINERFNKLDQDVAKLDQDVAVLMERTDAIRSDMKQESSRTLTLYTGGLVLYGGLIVAVLLILHNVIK